jgi:PTH1 family peptidyl-tRNA hydrolase
MKLIIGLWNPWDKYIYTRHNAWFLFLDYIKDKYNFWVFQFESKMKAEISTWQYQWEKCILLKPQTFMNLSWESIKRITDYYKIDIQDWIVLYDDMSLEFWKLRYRQKWSAWWHNWIKDIIRLYGQGFNRVKIWIWQDTRYEVSDWVLSKFTEEELIDLDNEVFKETKVLLEEKF